MSKFDANTENNIPTKYDNPISDHLIPIKVEYLDSKTAAHSTLWLRLQIFETNGLYKFKSLTTNMTQTTHPMKIKRVNK